MTPTTTQFQTIQDLYEAMKASDPATLDEHGDFRTDLPTFDDTGDDDAPETEETVWSWSRTHYIGGHCANDLRLIERDDITYEVVRESPNSWIEATGEREIVETGGSHDDVVRAFVELDARRLLAGEGAATEWTVRPWPTDDSETYGDSNVEPEMVYDFLVDELGVDESEASDLLQ